MNARILFAASELIQILTAALIASWIVLIEGKLPVHVGTGVAVLVMIVASLWCHSKGEGLAADAMRQNDETTAREQEAAKTTAAETAEQRKKDFQKLLESRHAITDARLRTLATVGVEADILEVLRTLNGATRVEGTLLRDRLEDTIGPARTAERLELILRYTQMRANDQETRPSEGGATGATTPPVTVPA